MIDVTTCSGCRRGVHPFIIVKGQLCHLDPFLDPHVSYSYPCQQPDVVLPLLNKESHQDVWVPTPQLEVFYDHQAAWWENALFLAHEVFDMDTEAVTRFFEGDATETSRLSLSNEAISLELLALASAQNIAVSPEIYSALLDWSTDLPVPPDQTG